MLNQATQQQKQQEKQETITIEINGKSYDASPGQMLIQVADQNGIYIPRFCYHKKLTVAANCRMCLVDIEGARKPSPACATPITSGMKVHTNSSKTLSYQKAVMEFLLINHPLDCPICDQGGECELQDLAMGYGRDVSKYNETKRVCADPSLGPLIATDMTRCIQCTRCVRFSDEIAGDKELGAMGRSDHVNISTYIGKTVDSELSGNMIDLCPVGALTSKPFRFQARAWELKQYKTISAADAIGASIYAHVRNNELMRVVPKENEQVNETWIADKDRFAYTGVYANDRIQTPMIKKDGEWQEASWQEALEYVKKTIEITQAEHGSEAISALASESLTTESLYLLQKFIRQLGANNIDYRLKQGDLKHSVYNSTGFDCTLEEIESADVIVLIGSNLRKEIPLVNHRVYKAVKNNAGEVLALNSCHYPFNYPVDTILVESNELAHAVASLLKSLLQHEKYSDLSKELPREILQDLEIAPAIETMATRLLHAKKPMLIMGFDGLLNKDFSILYALFHYLKSATSAKGGMLSFGANSQGALMAGATPDYLPKLNQPEKTGASATEILSTESKTKLLFLANVEPELDYIDGKASLSVLAEMKVIALSTFANQAMLDYADIILPTTTHYETDGSFINITGITQHFKAVIPSYLNSKPLWKILRVLGNIVKLEGFDYQTIDEVYNEFHAITMGKLQTDHDKILKQGLPTLSIGLNIMPMISMYQTDGLLRRAQPLNETNDAKRCNYVIISTDVAARYHFENTSLISFESGKRNGKSYILPVIVDSEIAKNTIAVPFQSYACIKALEDVKIKPVSQQVEKACS